MLFNKKATSLLEKQTEMFEEKEKDREEREGKQKKEKLDGKDVFAMWLAGLITFIPAILFVCVLFGLVIWFFFLRFA